MSKAPHGTAVIEFPKPQPHNPTYDDVDFGGPEGPGGGGMLEARVARLESDVEYIKRDVAELKSDLKAFRAESSADSKSVSEEFKQVRSEMQEEFRLVRTEMRSDFRLLFGTIITVTLGLAGLMAKGFGWL